MDELKNRLSPEAFNNLEKWLNEPQYSDFREEINKLISNKDFEELEDAFYTHIQIGTGGIRGKVGSGPNRINLQTIGEAAQGLANFIKDFGEELKAKGVIVGYEARKMSLPFAQLCCSVFAANGIKAYLFNSLRSTPEVSFAVRFLKTAAGVQITASHNPRADNGFKFYWSDGGQVVPPLDLKFMEQVKKVDSIKTTDFSSALEKGLIQMVGNEVDEPYLTAIRGLSLTKTRSAKIVFSPMHGAGVNNVLPVLKAEGFEVVVVPEQASPDEKFPTAPNGLVDPEYPQVMSLAVALGEKIAADLVVNSDPDADRIGVASKVTHDSNKVQFLNGDQVGVVLASFVLEQLKLQNKLSRDSLVVETYETTNLISDIAAGYGVKVIDDLLVGFKFIGEVIGKLEDKNDFVFAAEESLGYLRSSFVRDKDAAIAALTLAELTSFLKDQGKTLVNYLDEIYQKYSYYKNILNMVEMQGRVGFENRAKIMLSLRTKPPLEIAGLKVLKTIDRLPAEQRRAENYVCGATGDQITFILSEDEKTKVTARPSGTEPKIKYYIQHQQKVAGDLSQTKNQVDSLAKRIEEEMLNLQERVLHATNRH
ncbi:MAG: phospho-sugar mutase [bacterium]|nr:phospho-sugar mutase [bacterium]